MSFRPQAPLDLPIPDRSPKCRLALALAMALSIFMPPTSAAVDEDAAERLAKKGNCFKCHAVNKRKKAPAYAEVADKYRDKPDARRTLYLHITGEPIVKLAEGDEPHAAPPSKSDEELYNLIDWILTRERRH